MTPVAPNNKIFLGMRASVAIVLHRRYVCKEVQGSARKCKEVQGSARKCKEVQDASFGRYGLKAELQLHIGRIPYR
jgi:hypothetical protein